MRACLLATALLLGNPAIATPPMDHAVAPPAKKEREVAKEKVPSSYIEGRWVDDAFEYKSDKGEWAKPTSFRVVKEEEAHAFKNASGETVTYETGDVIFLLEGRGWYKAKKDSPRIEDPMVPNPTGFKLEPLERQAIRATNLWRRAHNLSALIVDPILMRTARSRRVYNHYPNGVPSQQAAAANGFKGPVTDSITKGDQNGDDAVANLASEGPGEGHYKQLTGQLRMNKVWKDYRMNRIGVATTGPGGVWVHFYGRVEN